MKLAERDWASPHLDRRLSSSDIVEGWPFFKGAVDLLWSGQRSGFLLKTSYEVWGRGGKWYLVRVFRRIV